MGRNWMTSWIEVAARGRTVKHDNNLVLAENMMNHSTLWLLDETDGEHYNLGIAAVTKHVALSVSPYKYWGLALVLWELNFMELITREDAPK